MWLFVDIMIICFDIATIYQAIINSKNNSFEKNQKVCSILELIGFLFMIFMQIALNNLTGIILAVLGLSLTEFNIGIVFYEQLKDKEIV